MALRPATQYTKSLVVDDLQTRGCARVNKLAVLDKVVNTVRFEGEQWVDGEQVSDGSATYTMTSADFRASFLRSVPSTLIVRLPTAADQHAAIVSDTTTDDSPLRVGDIRRYLIYNSHTAELTLSATGASGSSVLGSPTIQPSTVAEFVVKLTAVDNSAGTAATQWTRVASDSDFSNSIRNNYLAIDGTAGTYTVPDSAQGTFLIDIEEGNTSGTLIISVPNSSVCQCIIRFQFTGSTTNTIDVVERGSKTGFYLPYTEQVVTGTAAVVTYNDNDFTVTNWTTGDYFCLFPSTLDTGYYRGWGQFAGNTTIAVIP